MPSAKNKYTDPKLRDQVKEEIQESDKGGAPGQWSARKAQMMAKEYKSRGGGYNTDKKDQNESQKHLSKWTEEEWQTKEGSGHAKKDDGTRKRYLPKKAWEEMSEKEKEETEGRKQEGSKEGKQFVSNTSRARSARKKANEEEDDAFDKKQEAGKKEESRRQTRSSTKKDEKSQAGETTKEKSPASNENRATKASGQKRSRGKDDEKANEESSSKKPKNSTPTSKKSNDTVGSKHDAAEPPAQQGSKSRLPKKGQTVHWKALPGWVKGTVVEVVTTDKEIDGKQVKASKDDPRIVLKSSSSGKIAIHKPDNAYFD